MQVPGTVPGGYPGYPDPLRGEGFNRGRDVHAPPPVCHRSAKGRATGLAARDGEPVSKRLRHTPALKLAPQDHNALIVQRLRSLRRASVAMWSIGGSYAIDGSYRYNIGICHTKPIMHTHEPSPTLPACLSGVSSTGEGLSTSLSRTRRVRSCVVDLALNVSSACQAGHAENTGRDSSTRILG